MARVLDVEALQESAVRMLAWAEASRAREGNTWARWRDARNQVKRSYPIAAFLWRFGITTSAYARQLEYAARDAVAFELYFSDISKQLFKDIAKG